ncbi:CheW-like protein [gamma proteobacterium HdN1]|nr:CheW-like protein [gamma proteobacterium HdN1]
MTMPRFDDTGSGNNARDASAGAKSNEKNEITLQWGTFRLGGEIYGINVMQIREVLRYTEITPVPGAQYFVLGIINLRGNVVTVVDARRRFGLPDIETTNNTRIMIVETQGLVVGMLVDSVADVTYLRQSEIELTPNVGNDESSKFIQGVCHKNDELLILIDLEKLIEIPQVHDVVGF